MFLTTFARLRGGSRGCSKSAIRASISATAVLMIARSVWRSRIVRASEIGKRRNLCGYSRWGSKCGCAALCFNQESILLLEGCDPPENAAQMLRALVPNAENQNAFATPSRRSWRNPCASESSKELRIATGSTATPRYLRPPCGSGRLLCVGQRLCFSCLRWA